MEFPLYNATIYTLARKVYMSAFRYCKKCCQTKSLSKFYAFRKRNSCISCLNKSRRNKYKKSVCRHCSVEFRPDIEGRYKFCSDKCRFLKKIKVDDSSGCWIWQAGFNNKGYGCFVFDGKKSGLATRASFVIFKGPIPEKLFILHSCHNTKCVNPDHLRAGTQQENVDDMMKAGRHKKKSREAQIKGVSNAYG